MLRILYGEAGRGKSSAIMREIKRGGGSGGRYILLVPEQYSHEAERELCEVCGDGLSLYAEVLSFTGLARSIEAEVGGGAEEYLDSSGKLLCMALCAENLYFRLRVYGSMRRSAELQTLLLGEMDELKTAGVSSLALAEAAETVGGALGDKLYDLSIIAEGYNAAVKNSGADPADRLTVLADRIALSSVSEKTHIFVDGFTDFTAQERNVLHALLLKGAQITVCLGCDRLEGGSEVFAISRRTARGLLNFARERGIDAAAVKWEGESTKAEALTFFAENMFGYGGAAYGGRCDCIRAVRAASAEDECEYAAAEALRLIRETGCRRRDIAVCARGFEDYRLNLESAFSKRGIPLYTARRSDVASKPLPALISAAYEVILGGWEAADVFEYLRTGFAGLTPEETDELENYVFLWQLHGPVWTQSAPWRLHPEGYGKEFDEKSEQRLDKINALRNTAAAPLMHFAEAAASASDAVGQARALLSLLDELELAQKLSERAEELSASGRGAQAQEYQQLWELTVSALEQCAAVLGGTESDAEYFGRLFTLILSRCDVGTIPASLDTVTAGELDRMRRRSIKHLIVIGADDERLPGAENEGGVFSSDERSRLLDAGIDLGGAGESELWRSLSTVYNCLTLPSDSLSFCFGAVSPGGETRRPSFLVNRARALFNIEISEFNPDEARLSTPATALAAAAQSLHGGGVYAQSAAEFFRRHSPERLAALEKAAAQSRGSLSRDSVRELYGEKLRLSASRIDKFASCRFAYFMQYALKAKPREPALFSAPELGTFMHEILERVSREAAALGGYKSVSDEKLCELTDKYVAQFVSEELNDFRERSARFEHLFRRLVKNARRIVLDLADELRRSDFEPLCFELDFSKASELPQIELGSGDDSLVLTGIADRVDGWLHEGKLYLRIIDYKTGGKSFRLSDVLYGKNLQMLLYLFSLGETGGRLFGKETVPAGVLYVPARDKSVSADFCLSDDELLAERAKSLKRSGLILNDHSVINAMEHSDTPRYIPVSFRGGKASGDALASAEQLGALSRHIASLLCDMAAQLRRGSIAADPYYAGQQENACLNCDYFDACRFRDGENGENLRLTPHLPATKVWSVLEGGDGI